MQQLPNITSEIYKNILYSNSPWLKNPAKTPETKEFFREVFFRVEKHMFAQHQMAVLIKGPRRVGKTEIQKQLIHKLLTEKKIKPKRVLYLSLDDIQIQAESSEKRFRLVNGLLNEWAKMIGFDTFDEIEGKAFCFLDEVQTVGNWAHLVKNRIERNPNVRIVLSGSAAHSIFQKALETLLGRVIAETITPFSFREFAHKNELIDNEKIKEFQQIQQNFEKNLSAKKLSTNLIAATQKLSSTKFKKTVNDFLHEGGFPQLWEIDEENIIEKARLIDENYVKKVTLEDLMLLREIKKPELFERLLRHLFARPGQEYNQQKTASVLGTTTVTLAEALKLMKQTELLLFVEKLSTKSEPLKRPHLKIYPVDLALTFAMTKVVPMLDHPKINHGMIAESLVAQTIFRLSGISKIGFLKKESALENFEIDFYLQADTRDCPIEVKYQNQIRGEDIIPLQKIVSEKNLDSGALITPRGWYQNDRIYSIPLWAFLLIS